MKKIKYISLFIIMIAIAFFSFGCNNNGFSKQPQSQTLILEKDKKIEISVRFKNAKKYEWQISPQDSDTFRILYDSNNLDNCVSISGAGSNTAPKNENDIAKDTIIIGSNGNIDNNFVDQVYKIRCKVTNNKNKEFFSKVATITLKKS